MIQKADSDRDGLINEEEFYNVMTRKVGKWFVIFMKLNWIIYVNKFKQVYKLRNYPCNESM